MSITTTEITGVLQGPFGSLVRKQHGINDADSSELFSEPGRQALFGALGAYREAGATIGGAPTYRLTHLRPQSTENDQWQYLPHRSLEFDPVFAERNRAAVKIAKAAYGDRHRIFGLLAPIADTSGAHDAQWHSLGKHQGDFARQRHAPQIHALQQAGIEDFLVEAGRYVAEAEALAFHLADEGAKTVAFSFEAPDGGIPDPAHPRLRFSQMREKLHDAARGRIATLVGINCVDPSAVYRVLDNDDCPEIVYPNKPRNRTPGPEEYRALFRDCLQGGAAIIGVCCGGIPEHIAIARSEYDAFVSPA